MTKQDLVPADFADQAVQDEISTLRARLAVAEAQLKWYADEENWNEWSYGRSPQMPIAHADRGMIARKYFEEAG